MASDDNFGIPHADDYLTQLGRRRLNTSESEILSQSIVKIKTLVAGYSPFKKQSAVIGIMQLLNKLEARFRKEKNRKNLARVYELQTVFEQLRY